MCSQQIEEIYEVHAPNFQHTVASLRLSHGNNRISNEFRIQILLTYQYRLTIVSSEYGTTHFHESTSVEPVQVQDVSTAYRIFYP